MSKQCLTQEKVEQKFQEIGWKLVDKYIKNNIKVKAICPYWKKDNIENIILNYIKENQQYDTKNTIK